MGKNRAVLHSKIPIRDYEAFIEICKQNRTNPNQAIKNYVKKVVQEEKL